MYLIIPLVTPPKEMLNKIQVDMYKFIWGGKPDKIKRDVVNNSKEHGGLDMIDFKEFFTSLKSKLVGILISDNYNPTWKHIVLSQLRNDSVEMCIENKQVKRGCRFTEDLLAHYDTFLSKAELAGGCFRNRSLWNNRYITDMDVFINDRTKTFHRKNPFFNILHLISIIMGGSLPKFQDT